MDVMAAGRLPVSLAGPSFGLVATVSKAALESAAQRRAGSSDITCLGGHRGAGRLGVAHGDVAFEEPRTHGVGGDVHAVADAGE
ncbi:hypothetical protein [Amycolatopsis sp. RTGN1]|uniref:hypothetical protein n=1 Tax=Amycolatopsis ponsaeliensis TaxID=2992142 RepID=UPI00254C0EFF|nr:hypothetical protein [Amycolatopsis sp. RTGN1]